jgi:hypothetical protein
MHSSRARKTSSGFRKTDVPLRAYLDLHPLVRGGLTADDRLRGRKAGRQFGGSVERGVAVLRCASVRHVTQRLPVVRRRDRSIRFGEEAQQGGVDGIRIRDVHSMTRGWNLEPLTVG